MPAIYFRADGSASLHPLDRESARQAQRPRYDDGERCPVCETIPGHACSIKYTANGYCIMCARRVALAFHRSAGCGQPWDESIEKTDDMRRAVEAFPLCEFFNLPTTPQKAAEMKSPVYLKELPCERAGHLGLRVTATGKCWFCEQEKTAREPRIEARRAGQSWYTPTIPCDVCGTLSARRVHDDQCSKCVPPKRIDPNSPVDGVSPRQAALLAGERWYTPTTPCKRCGTLAPRAVANGQCSGCTGATTDQAERDDDGTAAFMAAAPDLIISRADARALGMVVYRTGTACKRGHAGFRYVSTGGCIACLRGGV